jgi:hypothetical protein
MDLGGKNFESDALRSTIFQFDPFGVVNSTVFSNKIQYFHDLKLGSMHSRSFSSVEIAIESNDFIRTKNNMGLTPWTGLEMQKSDVVIAKNYLNEKKIEVLNKIVLLYLDFAELQALEQRPMYMKDCIEKFDDFLKISNKQILTHAGKITHELAALKAEAEYDKYRALKGPEVSLVEQHFEESLKEVKLLEKKIKKK